MIPDGFRDLLSGRKRGWLARLARGALSLAELPYRLAVAVRNRRYDRNPDAVLRVSQPVVSVGNLTTGGTGKTPLVAWLAWWFAQRGVRVAIVSRGYGARRGAANDEARELAQRLPGVPHLQDPNRHSAAQLAIARGAELLVLDDAFQHRRLHRDLDIVLIDALEPFGYGHLLPRGLLREPTASLRRAQVVVLSRADQVESACRHEIRARVRRQAPDCLWAEVAHRPKSLLAAGGDRVPADSLLGRRVLAFCGIGNPAGFRATIESMGLELLGFREFPDHHAYSPTDLESLARWCDSAGEIAAVLCTHKDLVKVQVAHLGKAPVWAVLIDLEFLAGQEELESRYLQRLVESRRGRNEECP